VYDMHSTKNEKSTMESFSCIAFVPYRPEALANLFIFSYKPLSFRADVGKFVNVEY